ncbi:MAG: AAA family ATPase [Anaerolineales bacterium]|nr:AAA family ATPase [Anaerolineales bacterium]
MGSEEILKGLPEGTVTFLFTDIEGSTELLKMLGDAYATLLADQCTILRACFTKWNGKEVDTQGDAFFYSFPRATEAVSAAVEAQRAISSHDWPEGVEVRIRMGLHTGEPSTWEEGYVGIAVHRAARIAHVGHGGQVLLSETTAALVLDELPEGVSLIDLGRHRLKDIRRPERIRQCVLEGLPCEFPALKSLEALPFEMLIQPGPVRLPAFLEEEAAPVAMPVFVGRERELTKLDGFLERALGGLGQLVFITGGPGRGKTALMDAFARRSMKLHEALLAVSGECSAYFGVGDPYLPFRGVISMLAGDLEARWMAGGITREHAVRLWENMPATAQALVELGPNLIDTFVSGKSLVARARAAVEAGSNWLERLSKLSERDIGSLEGLEQKNLFEQCEDILAAIAEDHPLILALDDLQWADTASINLLIHLGRQLVGKRILILGAYRPEEVALGRGDGPHPMEKVLAEFKRQYGDVWIDLGETPEVEGHQFVVDFLGTEPNRLSADFQKALYEHTAGHPLFTVELLRDLQERGDLTTDDQGRWVEGSDLDWSVLPPRVEGVIEERIGRLEKELRDLLMIASVEGMSFTAQVVSKVRKVEERRVVSQLSQELVKKHHLISEMGILEGLDQRLYQYRFRHFLFQQHLYHAMGDFERVELHGEVGAVLEELYGERASEIAPRLAHHFTEAGEPERAIDYLIQAGDQARMVYANAEAIETYQRALAILEKEGAGERVAQTLMKLGLVYTADFQPAKAKKAYDRAFELWEIQRKVSERPEPSIPVNVFRMAIWEPHTLDPGRATDDESSFMIGQLFEGLVSIDPEYNVLPAAASRWEVLGGGKRYIFHIREDLLWSDGSTLSAADFEYAWKRNLGIRKHPHGSKHLYVIENARSYGEGEISDPDIVGVNALDDLTLEVRLELPIPYLPFLMAHSIAAPLRQKTLESENQPWTSAENLVSNGPFYLAEFRPGERLVLQRNPFYRGRFPGNVNRVECSIITDYSLAFEAYERGALDAIDMIASDLGTMARARRLYPEEFSFTPHLSTFYLTFRTNRSPFDDVRIRHAFAHAVDRETLVREASQGAYLPALGGVVPPGMPGHSMGIGLAHDPDLARNLLAEAGYPGGRGFPRVSWIHAFSPKDNPIIPLLRQAWRSHLDLDIEPLSVSWKEFFKRREQDPWDLALSAWSADYPDPDAILRLAFHSTEGINPPRWQNSRFDDLVEEAMSILDQEQRLELYREADRILVAEEAAILPIYYAQGRKLIKPWVKMPLVTPVMLKLKEVVVQRENLER